MTKGTLGKVEWVQGRVGLRMTGWVVECYTRRYRAVKRTGPALLRSLRKPCWHPFECRTITSRLLPCEPSMPHSR